MKKTLLSFLFPVVSFSAAMAQGTLTGNLQMNTNFYQGDSFLRATNPVFYGSNLSGGEMWLNLQYNYKGFTATVRVDGMYNSALYLPTQAQNTFGIGMFSLSKEIGALTVTAGYVYDQIGSGILFRAYEDRGLLIDNALVGLHLKYKLTPNIMVKGFTGVQKDVSAVNKFYAPVIKGLNAEGDFNAGSKVHLSPGIGLLNRTLDQNSMNAIVSNINSLSLSDRFLPKYNVYAFTAYNSLTAGNFSWYAEGAYKTHEAIADANDKLVDKAGNVEYTTLGYAQKGIAINLGGKRTEDFLMRTSPNERAPRGVLNWQPIIARLRPQRLMSRYTPASQDLSEMAGNADVLISPSDKFDVTLTYTHINTLEAVKLYREVYAELEYRGFEKWIFLGGAQYLEYNQELYQQLAFAPIVKAVTPFAEATYRITKKKSLRLEMEYQNTKQDYGSWLFALLEYNIAPQWSFSLSDMWNVKPAKETGDGSHYYNAFIAYTKGPHRFTLAYVKQVDGINCTGGVCRYEPAFKGVKCGITTSF